MIAEALNVPWMWRRWTAKMKKENFTEVPSRYRGSCNTRGGQALGTRNPGRSSWQWSSHRTSKGKEGQPLVLSVKLLVSYQTSHTWMSRVRVLGRPQYGGEAFLPYSYISSPQAGHLLAWHSASHWKDPPWLFRHLLERVSKPASLSPWRLDLGHTAWSIPS